MNAGSKDFKGLNFLDTLLQNKRIVLLGESSHGTEEYSQIKLQLIQYLHEKLGFNVVLFESPMTPATYFNLAKDSVAADTLIRNTIQTIWHTETVLKLFQYMKENSIYFGGIDPQFIPSAYPARLYSTAFTNYPAIKKELLQLENRIGETFTSGKQDAAMRDSFSLAYSILSTKLGKLLLTPLQQWIRHTLTINTSYYAHINRGNERDSCMAKNLTWLAEQLYPNEKIIVWAHNSHIDKNSTSAARFMGKIAAEHFGKQLYAVGLYMINGTTALNNRSIIPIKDPSANSLEGLLSARGFKTTFINTNDEIFNRAITTFHWGKDKQKLNLSKSYDAVILINGASPPVYLKE
jgi:erythromycin esterase